MKHLPQFSEDISPFGPNTQKYWARRYEYFSRFDEGIQTDAEGLYSVLPEDAALRQASLITNDFVLDAFAGIGGAAIGFARGGKRVIAVEIDQSRLDMARANARIYGVDDKINFICADVMTILDQIPAPAVYLDPPWGGPDYQQQGAFRLRDFSPDGRELLTHVLPRYAEVLLRVPRTFAADDLRAYPGDLRANDDLSRGRLVSRSFYFPGHHAA
jgi:trimethylguanosine synthase